MDVLKYFDVVVGEFGIAPYFNNKIFEFRNSQIEHIR
jgi:energy-converting hydrogenase Eha subunit H